jgi:hypothetical protein
MGFCPLRRVELTAATCPGLPHPVRALSGFRTLVALYSAVASRVCFAPVAPMGFCPSEHSPCTKWGAPSREPVPSCRWPTRERVSPTSGPHTWHRAVTASACLRLNAARALVGLTPFRAFTSPVQSPRKEGIRSWACMRSAHSPDPQRPTACCHAGESA